VRREPIGHEWRILLAHNGRQKTIIVIGLLSEIGASSAHDSSTEMHPKLQTSGLKVYSDCVAVNQLIALSTTISGSMLIEPASPIRTTK
jgi:hypothetical protein